MTDPTLAPIPKTCYIGTVKRLALFAVFLAPLGARAQENAVEVVVPAIAPAPTAAPLASPQASLSATLAAPALPTPALAASAPAAEAAPVPSAPAAVAASAASATSVPTAATAASPAHADAAAMPTSRIAAKGPHPLRATRAVPTAANLSVDGRSLFDGAALSGALPSGAASADEGPRLAPGSVRAAAPASAARRIALRRGAGEVGEVATTAAGWQLLTAIAFLAAGAHAAFPLFAGVFWAWGGAEMIRSLGKIRATIVGGWQASHDQKMRTDYGTGKLVDIRGRKYGEDRYDVWAPGAVSARERNAIDAAAFVLGLPWVWAAGPKGLALYGAAALATIALRRWWRRTHPQTPPPASNEFEYDR